MINVKKFIPILLSLCLSVATQAMPGGPEEGGDEAGRPSGVLAANPELEKDFTKEILNYLNPKLAAPGPRGIAVEEIFFVQSKVPPQIVEQVKGLTEPDFVDLRLSFQDRISFVMQKKLFVAIDVRSPLAVLLEGVSEKWTDPGLAEDESGSAAAAGEQQKMTKVNMASFFQCYSSIEAAFPAELGCYWLLAPSDIHIPNCLLLRSLKRPSESAAEFYSKPYNRRDYQKVTEIHSALDSFLSKYYFKPKSSENPEDFLKKLPENVTCIVDSYFLYKREMYHQWDEDDYSPGPLKVIENSAFKKAYEGLKEHRPDLFVKLHDQSNYGNFLSEKPIEELRKGVDKGGFPTPDLPKNIKKLTVYGQHIWTFDEGFLAGVRDLEHVFLFLPKCRLINPKEFMARCLKLQTVDIWAPNMLAEDRFRQTADGSAAINWLDEPAL